MNDCSCATKRLVLGTKLFLAFLFLAGLSEAWAQMPGNPAAIGPYNAAMIPDGVGVRIPLRDDHDSILTGSAAWTMSCWLKVTEPLQKRELVAGFGEVTSEHPRYLAVSGDGIELWTPNDGQLKGAIELTPNVWHMLTAAFDGSVVRLYGDGREVAAGPIASGTTTAIVQLAPESKELTGFGHYGGKIAGFQVFRRAYAAAEVEQLKGNPPSFDVILYEEGSKPWPLQSKQHTGLQAPQDASEMPVGHGRGMGAAALQRSSPGPSLTKGFDGAWEFADGWMLREEPKVEADGARLSSTQYVAKDWMRATVPGTVLTTMIDDGVYPDPDYGMNNLLIPETLNKQDYWYRNEFTLPEPLAQAGSTQHFELIFEGINYKAQVWLNGTMVGMVDGAFERGHFDVGPYLHRNGRNVLAVRISPPPHPGIPHEQSILAGPGPNGGAMMIDGPTFGATEGWDWMPAMRDRDSGLWQAVKLRVTGSVRLGDVQVVPRFSHHDMSRTSLDIDVPMQNLTSTVIHTRLNILIENIVVDRQVTLSPGETTIRLRASDFPQLNLNHPRLWWPNGYGKPELYHAKVVVGDAARPVDSREVQFGIREVSYELSLLDQAGHLQRVEFTPAEARGLNGPVVDVSHEGIREVHQGQFVESLTAVGEGSPAIERLPRGQSEPYLVIKVNGVRIAARGGDWGMDDSRKRVSREHMEPFFRLHRDANLNIIRNWIGQNTEEIFYQLADEYGLMVWNDFWESTQNWNAEAADPALFLANAKDTVRRYRNHPSIVVWCGRNEGVPQPILNKGLDSLIRSEDGTRFYSPSSIRINLQKSGPWDYEDPTRYYTTLARGFTTETGTMSMPTLESFKSTMTVEDQWPISDAWSYHDWHTGGGSNVLGFMKELDNEFGQGTSLEDFERKAQMMQYVSHRAIFEGMAAHLWAPNSGRLLWMTQPAWPSTVWQIMSSDYDTQASFYATKKACEPVHVQLDLATHQVQVVNTTTEARNGLTVSARVYSLHNELLFETESKADAPADATQTGATLDLATYFEHGVVLVALDLRGRDGRSLSSNLYWLGKTSESYRELTSLAKTSVSLSAVSEGGSKVKVTIKNNSGVVSLMNKLTLLGSDAKTRVLPAYYSDNYVSLLPYEAVSVEIDMTDKGGSKWVALRGWNAEALLVPVEGKK